jgi:hypothetical protein
MAKFRLLTDCFIDGRRYRGTSVIEKPLDWKGPTRPIRRPIGGRSDRQEAYPDQDVQPLFKLLEETS